MRRWLHSILDIDWRVSMRVAFYAGVSWWRVPRPALKGQSMRCGFRTSAGSSHQRHGLRLFVGKFEFLYTGFRANLFWLAIFGQAQLPIRYSHQLHFSLPISTCSAYQGLIPLLLHTSSACSLIKHPRANGSRSFPNAGRFRSRTVVVKRTIKSS